MSDLNAAVAGEIFANILLPYNNILKLAVAVGN
jgi:hypothetical protein